MNTYEIIKELAKSKKIFISELERVLGVSNGFLVKWKRRKPNPIVLEEIADYFDVSETYRLGREKKETPKDVDLSEDDTVFSFDGKEISKETMRKAIVIAKALEENE